MKDPEAFGHIYALYDPKYGKVRYVGRTKQLLRMRLSNHLESARRKGKDGKFASNSRRSRWIRIVLAQGRRPEIKLLETVPINQQSKAELKWMSRFLNLVNSGYVSQRSRQSIIEWTPAILAKLGKMSDSIIAEEMGVSRKLVAHKRYSLGIPAANDTSRRKPPPPMGGHNKIQFPENIIALLGQMPDWKLAAIAGVSKKAIARARMELGIPSYAETTGNTGQFKKGNIPHNIKVKKATQLMLSLDMGMA